MLSSKKNKKPKRGRNRLPLDYPLDLLESPSGGGNCRQRRWEQRQVQIKTMEGEFSVTMWASGTDDDADSNPEPDPDYTEYMSGRKITEMVWATLKKYYF